MQNVAGYEQSLGQPMTIIKELFWTLKISPAHEIAIPHIQEQAKISLAQWG